MEGFEGAPCVFLLGGFGDGDGRGGFGAGVDFAAFAVLGGFAWFATGGAGARAGDACFEGFDEVVAVGGLAVRSAFLDGACSRVLSFYCLVTSI